MATSQRLKGALKLVTAKATTSEVKKAIQIVIWEIMATQADATKLQESTKRMQVSMDKKMHKVTEAMKKAEVDVKKNKPKAAIKVLKKAEKKNEKLVKIDKNVRDPLIDKAKKVKAKFPKDWGMVK